MIPRVEKIENLKLEILELVFPIGSRYVTQTAEENPANILGFGTWEKFNGLIAVGIKEEDSEFNEIGKITGEEKHTMTVNELVKHRHTGSLKSNSNVGN